MCRGCGREPGISLLSKGLGLTKLISEKLELIGMQPSLNHKSHAAHGAPQQILRLAFSEVLLGFAGTVPAVSHDTAIQPEAAELSRRVIESQDVFLDTAQQAG